MPQVSTAHSQMAASAEALKAEGNAAYAAGDNETALACYERAIALCSSGDAEEAAALLHILHSNAAAAAARLPGKAQLSNQHADTCVTLKPDWPKGYVRQAAAAHLLHRPGDAERALRAGLKACPAAADQTMLRHELQKLLQVRGGRLLAACSTGRHRQLYGCNMNPINLSSWLRLVYCTTRTFHPLQDDGDQSGLPGILPGTPAQKVRDFQVCLPLFFVELDLQPAPC